MSQLDLTIFSTNFISSLLLFILFFIGFGFILFSILINIKFRIFLSYGDNFSKSLKNDNKSIYQIKNLLKL
uniref:ATP synthase F0 subunit 8 n=1 Tax=Euphysa aurata TaxID=576745 RepID=A0A0S2IB76_9CNID|nr:ATP synthase F0 subunit 8 [Euphysa aurata]